MHLQSHSTCVTEHEKYALGATKPGGFAAQGFYGDGSNSNAGGGSSGSGSKHGNDHDNSKKDGVKADGGPSGLQFLSERPPWRCSVCNVSCTSRATLEGHAEGTKHKRKVIA